MSGNAEADVDDDDCDEALADSISVSSLDLRDVILRTEALVFPIATGLATST